MQILKSIKERLSRIAIISLLMILISNNSISSEPAALFRSDEVIRMEIRSDFFNLINDRTENSEYQDAELKYLTADKKSLILKVKIMTRGHFRRNPDNCSFPPLYINFKKSEVKNTVFENQDKLKLVTPCQGEDDLVEEYIIYKLYNRVTDMSLRVRLVKVSYYDTGAGKKLFERYSFFIENPEQAAIRNNAGIIEKNLTPFDLDTENYKKMTIFQYLIGNVDWNVEMGRNVIFMQPDDTAKAPCVVPYDFDFSAFVNAHYTLPVGVAEDIVANRRRYIGLCFPYVQLVSVFDLYNKLRPTFETIIEKQKAIPASDRDQLLEFLNDFYTVIDDEDLAGIMIQKSCRTPDRKNPYGNRMTK